MRWISEDVRAAGTLVLCAVACASPSLDLEGERPPPSYCSPPAAHGILAEVAEEVVTRHGPATSGFRVLDHNIDALTWRLALLDSAVSSIDIQTYLWYPDHTGRLVLDRAIRAADRGVRVRLVIDDLLLAGQDRAIYELTLHPNIEVRLFNPWKRRDALSRAGETIARMERLNVRMHDKLMIVDGCAAIIGGRNLGDHYFGLSSAFNFHDLDLLGFGPFAREADEMFDHFWNSEWVVSADNLTLVPDPRVAQEKLDAMVEKIWTAPELDSFPRTPADWTDDLERVREELLPGTSVLLYDEPSHEGIRHNMYPRVFELMSQAREELLVTNAYLIPSERGIELVRSLTGRGVVVRILTNSLASHDVPAVNSHYKEWRDDLVAAGAELYELRADPAIGSIVDVPPVQGGFTGLHTKALVVDRRFTFVGSMNLDPRSSRINTEAGVLVDGPELAEQVAAVMERDMSPENAWRVLLDANGHPYWVNSDETRTSQPSRGTSQRVMDTIFEMFPKEQF